MKTENEMTTETAKPPKAWSNEDSNYFADGHIDPATFKAACHAYDIECLGKDHECGGWDGECSADMELEDVRHEWMYPIDPANDETEYMRCEQGHAGAEAWTMWSDW